MVNQISAENANVLLREALAESGKKQNEIAKELGVNQSTISSNMNRRMIGLNIFVTMLTNMGFKVMVGKDEDGKFDPVWEVTSK